MDFGGIRIWDMVKLGGNSHLAFNQGVTGSNPVRPT